MHAEDFKLMSDLRPAIDLAMMCHGMEFRKGEKAGSKLPYIVHAFAVGTTVFKWGAGRPAMLKSSFTHDCKESKPDITWGFMEGVLGSEATGYNQELTFLPDPSWDDNKKAEVKNAYLMSFMDKSIESLVIKLADRYENTDDFLLENTGYAKEYWKKAEPLFEAFRRRKLEIVKNFGQDTYDIIAGYIGRMDSILQMVV
jgi:(p)ppGpp synthase/HD superfamily hydrolase